MPDTAFTLKLLKLSSHRETVCTTAFSSPKMLTSLKCEMVGVEREVIITGSSIIHTIIIRNKYKISVCSCK